MNLNVDTRKSTIILAFVAASAFLAGSPLAAPSESEVVTITLVRWPFT